MSDDMTMRRTLQYIITKDEKEVLVTVEIEIDIDKIARHLIFRAGKNKNKTATAACGAIKLKRKDG